jgi:hypothetical protein
VEEQLISQENNNGQGRGSLRTLSSNNTLYSLKDFPKRYHLSAFHSGRSLPNDDPYNDHQVATHVEHAEKHIYASASEKKYVPPLLLIGSVLGILCCTAGMATTMILWTYTHKLPLLSPGVIYLHEGDEDDMAREYTDKTIGDGAKLRFNQQSSHPTTLTLSSIIVFLIGGSLYPMMGLIAYGLAADWIQLQERVAISSNVDIIDQLPTPLQYALLTKI